MAKDKVANRDYMRRLRLKDPKRVQMAVRKSAWRKVGIEDIDEALRLWGSKAACEICGSKNKLGIDHDHKTGKIRGVLCTNCNTAIGLAKDSPDRLRLIIQYLERWVMEG